MDRISLHVLTSNGPVLERKVEAINLPTSFGSLGVLQGHAPMLCNLEPGVVRLRCQEGMIRLRIGGGIASVENNEVNLLVSSGDILED